MPWDNHQAAIADDAFGQQAGSSHFALQISAASPLSAPPPPTHRTDRLRCSCAGLMSARFLHRVWAGDARSSEWSLSH